MPNDKWIHFPKNPYEGQVFYYPATKDTFTYIIPQNPPDDGQWVLISFDLFMKFKSSRNELIVLNHILKLCNLFFK